MEVMLASRIGYTIFFYNQDYFKIEDIEACEQTGLDPCVPRPSVVSRSERVCSSKMSSAMTRPVAIFSAQRVSIFTPICLLLCVA